MLSGLVFAFPLVLATLALLPVLYYLLRLTPPPPRRIPLPTLPLVKDILGVEREPSRTPLWLLLARLALAASLIIAAAGPRWQPNESSLPAASGPLLLLIDDGWAAADSWKARLAKGAALLDEAASRPITLIVASDDALPAAPQTAREAMARLMSLTPRPYQSERVALLGQVVDHLRANPDAHLVWISDETVYARETAGLAPILAALAPRLTLITDRGASHLGIAGIEQGRDGLDIVIRRIASDGLSQSQTGLVRAFDEKGRMLGDAPFTLSSNAAEGRARLSMPVELRNDIARLDIADARHAGAVYLLDAAHRRRRVALVSGETTDTAQPLVSARYFLARALQSYVDLREPPRGAPDPIGRALEERPDLLVLADIGTISGETERAVTRFVENGGMLVRFAGPGLAAASDTLLPVRLRKGGRILGGALSWDKPQRMAAFPEHSPFDGLALRDEIRVERQVLAEPDSELSRLSWAILDDGTPLVTGAPRGKGQIVLFHVTGDTHWSNLPLSGTFVDMLRRLLLQAKGGSEKVGAGREKLAPRLALDGAGLLTTPPASARPIDPRFAAPATREHPPGFYGPLEASLAVNALSITDPVISLGLPDGRVLPLHSEPPLDLRWLLVVLACMLFALDALAVALLAMGGLRGFGSRHRSGGWPRWRARAGIGAGLLIAGLMLGLHDLSAARAQSAPTPPRAEDIRSSLRPRLAYILTGNRTIDETSQAGLVGLGQFLSQNTSFNPDTPVGLDPLRDELVFYSMIYWPIQAGQARPPEAALRAIDNFMKQGGTLVFDTRDAYIERPGGRPTPENLALRDMLATLDIPALEPLPRDHVLTKTFYLLDRLTGRYDAGETWVEALQGQSDAKVPARAGDRVSPIIITSNDLAAAWAVDRLARPLFPMVPGEPRQREFAYRSGVNLVMYVMTGNYKADQVHVKDLLERLGQ